MASEKHDILLICLNAVASNKLVSDALIALAEFRTPDMELTFSTGGMTLTLSKICPSKLLIVVASVNCFNV